MNRAFYISYDHEDAKGKIEINDVGYGITIFVDGKCIAMVDLYHLRPSSPDKFSQLVVYTGNDDDDPLGHIQWHENGRVEAQFDASHRGMWHELNRDMMEHNLTFPMQRHDE